MYLSFAARYQSDLEGEDAMKLAERFYCEAAMINPDNGNEILHCNVHKVQPSPS